MRLTILKKIIKEALEFYAWTYDDRGRLALIGKKDFNAATKKIAEAIKPYLKD